MSRIRLIEWIDSLLALQEADLFKREITTLKKSFLSPEAGERETLRPVSEEDRVSLRTDVLLAELDQILASRTLERARYYLKRLRKGVVSKRTGKLNDINLLRWKEYDHILTDSLWLLDKRDASGAHLAAYWGNFVPQIPRQMMLRYTKKGDWVLDPFLGSGTTLIECRRLGRNGVGIELNPDAARAADELIRQEENRDSVSTEVVVGDSRTVDIEAILQRQGVDRVQLLLLHPPYHDIIRFSEDASDLSNAADTDGFLRSFGEVVDRATPSLERGRHLVVVIGDKYSRGEWIPLGFYCMNEVLKRGYRLKSVVVKNFDRTKGKRSQKELWRYRALAEGFYVFKHEYILLFQKR